MPVSKRSCLIYVITGLLLLPACLFAWQAQDEPVQRRVPGFVSAEGPYRPSITRTTDILHTTLKLDFNWEKQEVNGQAVLAVKPYFYPLDSIVLDARAFDLREVLLVKKLPSHADDFDKQEGTPLSYRYDQFRLSIGLSKTYSRDDTIYLAIRYVARPNEAEKLNFQGAPVEKGLFFINPDGTDPDKPRQLWTQGETTGGSSWFPTIEAPNEKFTQDIFLTVENSQLSVSNGTLVGQVQHANGTRTDHWRQSLPHAPYLVAVVVGAFSKTSDQTDAGMEVSYYVDPAYAPYARQIFGRTPEMISFFSRLFGVPYPWQKYAQVVVRDFVSGAMENTTVTVLQEETQMTGRELLDGDSDALIAHELAHHWFGNLVTCEEWGQLPLNESFANYAEYLWEEHRHGKAAADWSGYLEMLQYLSESRSKNVAMIRYFYENADQMFDSHSYAKGGRILHLLRNYVGDEAFFASLSHYLKQKQFGTAELADLRIAFEEVTGKDLNWFFDQWFYRPGHPELDVSHYYLPAPDKLTVKIQQTQDTIQSTVYRLPLAIDIWIKGEKVRHYVVVDKAIQEFSFTLESAPDLVLFDADCALPGVIRHEKPVDEWMYQLRHDVPFLAKLEALRQLGAHLGNKAARESVREALQDPFWKIRQEAILQLAGYDGPDKEDTGLLFKKLAARDENPQVRGEALLALEPFGLKKHRDDLIRALDDSAYAVVATAIGLLAKIPSKNMEEVIARFENVRNPAVASAIGDFFGDNPKPQHFPWFTEMLSRLTPSGSYSLMQAFGKYLVRSDQEIQMKAIDYLGKQARQHAGMSVRYGAFQLLTWFDDKPGVKELLQEISALERNPRLIELYRDLQNH